MQHVPLSELHSQPPNLLGKILNPYFQVKLSSPFCHGAASGLRQLGVLGFELQDQGQNRPSGVRSSKSSFELKKESLSR